LLFLYGKGGKPPGLGYILILGGFIAAAKQNDDFLPGILIVHPVTGAVIDTHLGNITKKTVVPGVPLLEPLNSGIDAVSGPLVPQVFYPFFVDIRFTCPHWSSVAYGQHIVKGSGLFFLGIARLFLPGAAPLGDFPNRFKGRVWVDDLPSNGFYSQGTEPLVDRPFRYAELFGQFLYCESFHNQSISKIFKKVKIFLSKVIDKLKIFLYDVIRGDKDMAKKLFGAREAEELEARVAGIGREFYQHMEEYPAPEGWSYMDFFMFIHQRIYDEVIKLKKAVIVTEHSGGAVRREAS
jgi:hypothetical protein